MRKLSELTCQVDGGHNSGDYLVLSANENIVVFQYLMRCLCQRCLRVDCVCLLHAFTDHFRIASIRIGFPMDAN